MAMETRWIAVHITKAILGFSLTWLQRRVRWLHSLRRMDIFAAKTSASCGKFARLCCRVRWSYTLRRMYLFATKASAFCGKLARLQSRVRWFHPLKGMSKSASKFGALSCVCAWTRTFLRGTWRLRSLRIMALLALWTVIAPFTRTRRALHHLCLRLSHFGLSGFVSLISFTLREHMRYIMKQR